LTSWEPVSFSGKTLLHGVSKQYTTAYSSFVTAFTARH